MKIGFYGLGRMGANMVLNLLDHGHKVIACNRSPEPVKEMERAGAIGAYSVEEMVAKLPEPKIVWLMVKSGKPVDELMSKLVPLLRKGDIIIDGGNSYFEDSIRRYTELKRKGILFLDCGTSGGKGGARHGACMMIGGEEEVFKQVEPLFRDMSVKEGYGYMGKPGAGHFVKMVHNGIEYGMMGAIAEGIEAVKKAPFGTDLKKAVSVYAHGSIIESKLVNWLLDAYLQDGYLDQVSGEVPLGETEEEMEKLEKLAGLKVLHTARMMRVETRKNPTYAGKLLAAMRNQFGGHAVKKEE